MKILHLIDSLDYHGSARQLLLLCPALAKHAAVEICCLGPDTPWSMSLRQAGVPVHTLGWTRWFDFGALWKLREILGNPAIDVIHVWRLPALRILSIVANQLVRRAVMSAPLPAKGRLAWWDRRLLQQVRCLAVAGISDQQHCMSNGLVKPTLRVVPAAVAPQDRNVWSHGRNIVCIANLEREAGIRQAIWCFDLLRVVHPEARLQIVGAGSQLAALRELTNGLEANAHVQFLGAQANIANVLREAALVWVPSLANLGRQVALDAMAHGRTVIASDVPCLREVVRDGETGALVPAGDVAQLARSTHALLKDDRLRERIGETARQFVWQRFPLDDAVARWRDLYRLLAGRASDGPAPSVARASG